MQTSLRGISNRAAKDKGHRFGNLYGVLDENFLKRCFWQLKRDAAPGVDQVDFYEYQGNLDENIADLVKRLKQKKYRAKLVRRQYIPKFNGKLRPLGIPVAVISNASLIWRPDVAADLLAADWVSLKMDAAEESIWRRINRPHRSLSLEAIQKGALDFASIYEGMLVTETMLVREVNDQPAHLVQLAAFLGQLEPATAYLSAPIRPPAESWVQLPEEAALNRAFPFVTTTTTEALRQDYVDLSDNVNQLVSVMGLVSLLIGSIGIINTMQVIVRRRTIEIAVLKTIGLQANEITVLFMVVH